MDLDKTPKITPYQDAYRQQILEIWQRSVLATHYFLKKEDFEDIKELVAEINFNDLMLHVLVSKDQVLGFVGVADQKVEMLFLDPDYFGQRLGYRLMEFVVKKLKADKVDVNEQNEKAYHFYKKFGFETFERTQNDAQGRNYPILRMKLKSPE